MLNINLRGLKLREITASFITLYWSHQENTIFLFNCCEQVVQLIKVDPPLSTIVPFVIFKFVDLTLRGDKAQTKDSHIS